MTETIFITGASSGIGKATALYFQDKGWNVVATLRDPAQAGDLAALPGVLVTRLDVTDSASVTAAVDAGVDARADGRGGTLSSPRSGSAVCTRAQPLALDNATDSGLGMKRRRV